jgi:dolichyl-phosphate beta-glucosyltransferase
MRPALSLVIASYNSSDEIERTLCRVQEYLGKQPYLHEVLVVDDGSTDGTEAVLLDFCRHYSELQVLTNARNMGKGYSIKKGVLEAAGHFIFYTDVDLAYPIEGIASFLNPLREVSHDVVVGSRVHPASRFHLHPRYFRYVHKRHLTSRFFNWSVRRLFGIEALDTQCGFKGFTAEAAKAIFSRIEIRGFAFDVEVLLVARRLGYRVAGLPVVFAYEGEVSTVKFLKIVCQTPIDLTRIYWWDRRGRYSDKA